jgi:hypothetical protein
MVKKQQTTRLSEKAMLVRLTVSVWTGRTKDKVVSQEVTTAKHASSESGAWWTYLVPREHLKAIGAADSNCRTVWRKRTLPWTDEGCRILPSKMYMDYTNEMRKAITQFDEAVHNFVENYPTILGSAKKRLGDLAQTKQFPTVNEVKYKFGIRQTIYPMPDAADFRVNLSEDDADAIRDQISTIMNDTIKNAMSDIWGQMAALIGKVEEILAQPDKIFRGSLIGNLKEFCDLLPKLNLMDDENLEEIRKETLEKLAKLSPDDLRDNKIARKKAAKTAGDVLKKMKTFME